MAFYFRNDYVWSVFGSFFLVSFKNSSEIDLEDVAQYFRLCNHE